MNIIEKMKYIVRWVVSSSLLYSGILHIYMRLNKKFIILTYHHVIENYQGLQVQFQPGMYVTSRTFEKHLKFLKKNFNVVGIDKLKNIINKLR